MKNKDVKGFEFDVKETKQRGEGGNYNYEKLEEDEWYDAIFVKVERHTAPFGEVLNWYFELVGEEYSYEYEGEVRQRRVRGTSSLICTPKSKMYAWYKKLVGEEPEPGDRIDLTSLYGTHCRIMVKNAEGKKEDDEGNVRVYSNVVNIKLAKGKKKATPTKQTTKKAKPGPKKVKKEVEEEEPEGTKKESGDLFGDLDDIF